MCPACVDESERAATRFTSASGRILIFTSGMPSLCIVIRERPTTASKGEKSGHELWAVKGDGRGAEKEREREKERKRARERDIYGVIRFLANYSRVPLTSPICLDYEASSAELRSASSRPRRAI